MTRKVRKEGSFAFWQVEYKNPAIKGHDWEPVNLNCLALLPHEWRGDCTTKKGTPEPFREYLLGEVHKTTCNTGTLDHKPTVQILNMLGRLSHLKFRIVKVALTFQRTEIIEL